MRVFILAGGFGKRLCDSVPDMPKSMAPNKSVSLENDIIPSIIDKGSVYGLISEGYFIDIGTPDSYTAAQYYLNATGNLRRNL